MVILPTVTDMAMVILPTVHILDTEDTTDILTTATMVITIMVTQATMDMVTTTMATGEAITIMEDITEVATMAGTMLEQAAETAGIITVACHPDHLMAIQVQGSQAEPRAEKTVPLAMIQDTGPGMVEVIQHNYRGLVLPVARE